MDSNSAWAMATFTSDGTSVEFTNLSHLAMASGSFAAEIGMYLASPMSFEMPIQFWSVLNLPGDLRLPLTF